MKSNDFESLYRRAGAYCARRETYRGDLEKKFRPAPAANAHPPSENTHRLTDRHRLPSGNTASPSGNAPALSAPRLVHLLRAHRLAPFARPAPDFAPRPSDAGRFFVLKSQI